MNIWKDAGCTEEGQHQPKDFADDELTNVASLDIR